MNHIQKLIAALLLPALCLQLVSCGKDDSKPVTNSASSSASSSTGSSSAMSSLSSSPGAVSSASGSSLTGSSGSAAPSYSFSSLPPVGIPELDYDALRQLDAAKRDWGFGSPLDKDGRPSSCTVYNDRYGKYDAMFIGPNQPELYLTFDEGYENGLTGKILDTLKEKNVKAVFFVTMTYAKANPDLISRMISEGHIVGNHSSKHPAYYDLSLENAAADAMGFHDYMLQQYGYTMTLFRFPSGSYNEQTLALLQQLGYKSVFWSFAYQDWIVDQQIGHDAAFSKITKGIHNGCILLLHAVSQDNADVLGGLIDYGRAQGYQWSLI